MILLHLPSRPFIIMLTLNQWFHYLLEIWKYCNNLHYLIRFDEISPLWWYFKSRFCHFWDLFRIGKTAFGPIFIFVNSQNCWTNNLAIWAVVVAQLVEWSLPIPEVRSLNPVIGKNLYILNIWLLSTVYWKDENKEKRGRGWPI